ncbi:hypothetical protein ScPMuIL_012502 [Solemya velum]
MISCYRDGDLLARLSHKLTLCNFWIFLCVVNVYCKGSLVRGQCEDISQCRYTGATCVKGMCSCSGRLQLSNTNELECLTDRLPKKI